MCYAGVRKIYRVQAYLGPVAFSRLAAAVKSTRRAYSTLVSHSCSTTGRVAGDAYGVGQTLAPQPGLASQ